MATAKVAPIRGALKAYAWGLSGRDSLAAALHVANGGTLSDADAPAAELWLGTHESGPAVCGARTLRDAIGGDVEFLLKVLSIARPLSIQAHPDKDAAVVLHARNPAQYKDGNHKPEMAVALTPFEGMCGFRAMGEIAGALGAQPALRELAGVAVAADSPRSALRELFAGLMRAPADAVARALEAADARIRTRAPTDADSLFQRLRKFYPDDAGCFCAYLLNHVRLAPGQALYMAANEPHAYLSGQCVEVMACSDNVVRAGLTPKFRDVDVLVDMLSYAAGEPALVTPRHPAAGTAVYRTDAAEFQLERYSLQPGERVGLEAHRGHGVLLVVEGDGVVRWEGGHLDAKMGFAACVLDRTELEIVAGARGVVAFRASTRQ